MAELTPPTGLRVGPSPGRGRGVFATRPFSVGELVEVAPVLVLPHSDDDARASKTLRDYVFGWGDGLALALGYGSLYNHAWQPNLEYRKRLAASVIEFVAIAAIAPGDELFINYASSHPEDAGLFADLI